MISTRQRRTVLRRYAKGATTREIAAEVGCDATTVLRVLDAAGIPRRGVGPRGRTDVPTETIAELREVGCSWQEIADACDMSRTGVRGRWLVEVEHKERWR